MSCPAPRRSGRTAVVALLLAAVLVGCGLSREEVGRSASGRRPKQTTPTDRLCKVLDQALPYLKTSRRTVAQLVVDRSAEAAGDGAIIAYGRLALGGDYGPYDRALRYLVRLYSEEDGPIARQPKPSPAVVASAKAIDREIARGRCR
jgi:hypothetical protein